MSNKDFNINTSVIFCRKFEGDDGAAKNISDIFTELNIVKKEEESKKEFYVVTLVQASSSEKYFMRIVLFYYGNKNPEVKHHIDMIVPNDYEGDIKNDATGGIRTLSGENIHTGTIVIKTDMKILDKTGRYGVAIYCKKYKAGDENNEISIGDMSMINEQQFKVEIM